MRPRDVHGRLRGLPPPPPTPLWQVRHAMREVYGISPSDLCTWFKNRWAGGALQMFTPGSHLVQEQVRLPSPPPRLQLLPCRACRINPPPAILAPTP